MADAKPTPEVAQADDLRGRLAEWEESALAPSIERDGERKRPFTTQAMRWPVKNLYTPADLEDIDFDYLRDAGMEVLFSGLKQTPEMVVQTAIDEDVDLVGLSGLSAAHMRHFPRVVEPLREQGAGEKLVIGGGVIPEEDAAELGRLGVARIFTMGTPTGEVVDYVRSWRDRRHGA